ncbi:MAG: DUF1585 domain-containing protein, partial [Myxococcaceae bacterium]|nr:DUF1585 domain-containing protein [Myxococcaceae bacterium]
AVAQCGACHKLMDPIGYAFLAYDGVGRPVASEDGKGEIIAGGELTGTFSSVAQLGERLASSTQAQTCFARQWLRYAAGRKDTTSDGCAVQTLADGFTETGDLNALFVGLPALDAFSLREGDAP